VLMKSFSPVFDEWVPTALDPQLREGI